MLLVVCDAVLIEVLRGVRHDTQAARVERDLRRLRVEPVSNPSAPLHYKQKSSTEHASCR